MADSIKEQEQKRMDYVVEKIKVVVYRQGAREPQLKDIVE